MNHTLLERAKVFLQAYKNKSIWHRITTSLAAVVVFVTTYMLILPAITMERPTVCGLEAHTHTKACYASSLKAALHEHDASCYDANGSLVCQRPVVRLHEHTDECYKDSNLICGQIAYQGHTHTDACYTWEKVLVCGDGAGSSINADGEILIDEGAVETPQTSAHVHTDDCYRMEKVLTCLLAEGPGHTHTAACYDGPRQLICGHDGMIEIIWPDSPVEYVSANDTGKILICGKKEHKHTDSCYAAETPQSETKAQTEPQIVTEAQTELATETQNTTEAETQVVTETEAVTEAEVETQIIVTEAQTEPVTEMQTATEAQTEPVTETQNTTEVETQVVTETEAATEAQTEFSTETETESETASEVETESDTEIQTETDTKTESEIATEAETEIETETETETETATETATEVATESEPETEFSIEIESESETVSEAETESGTETQTETETEVETETETEAETETESEIGTEAETETETEKETEIESETGEWTDEALEEAFKDGTIDSYCVVQRGIFAGNKVKRRMISRAAVNQGAVEFGQYLTSSTVMKINNGQWEAATEFNDGDQVKVSLSYSIPSGKITANQKQIYYQLPSGVRPIEKQTGKAYHGGVAVGNYVIDTDGMITIDFYDEFANGDPFTGNIDFSGTVTFADAGSDGKISFGGTGSTITIKKQEEQSKYDIKTEKKGVLSEDKETISYTVKTSTVNGTSDTVSIEDHFQNGNMKGEYKKDTFKIIKKDKAGNTTDVTGYTVNIDTSKTPQSFKIENLPKLGPGESYELTYDAKVTPTATTGEGSIANSAGSISGNSNNWAWNSVEVSKSMIKKGGYYDTNENVINWTITVNEDKRDITGYKVEDPLPSGLHLIGEYVVKNSAGEVVGKGNSFPYTFDQSHMKDPKDTYTITYQTNAPDTDQTVTNTARLNKDGKGYSSSAGVGVSHRTWGLSKRYDSEITVNNALRYKWQTNISLPAGEVKEFTYKDTILEPEGSTGDYHYAYASEVVDSIKKSLRLKVKGVGDTLLENNQYVDITITCYDSNNNVVQPTDNQTHVQRFEVKAAPKQTSGFEWQSLYFDYPTVADYSGMKPEDTWIFKNRGELGNLPSEAEHSYTLPKPLTKSVLKNGWTDDTTQIDYDASKGIISYRLLLRTTPDQKGEITVRDNLPSGATYVEGSIRGYFYGNDWHHYQKEGNYDFNSDAYRPTVRMDGQQMIITVKSGYNGDENTQLSSGRIIELQYRISIADDPFWKDLRNDSKYYTNSAEWNGSKDEQKTEINRKTDELVKEAEQIVEKEADGTERKTNRVKYTIRINPAGKDLDPNSDKLTLNDTLTMNGNGMGADLELDTVKLYYFDTTKEDGIGGVIAASDYTLQYDETKHQMTLTIPDETPCVLVYVYAMDIGNSADPKYTNEAELYGIFSTKKESQLKDLQSSAGVQKKRIDIYKVDSKNHTQLLDGAKFKLESWKDSNWKEVGIYEAKDGHLELNAAVGGEGLEYNVLYRVTEAEAPTGYAKTEKEYYFVYTDPTTNPNAEVDKAWYANGANSAGIAKENVMFVGKDGKTIYVPNQATSIKVQKVWVDSKGNTLSDGEVGVSGIKVKVKRSTKKPQGYRVKLRFEYNGTPYECLNQASEAGEVIVEPGSSISYMNGVAFHSGDKWSLCFNKALIDGAEDNNTSGYLDETTLHNGNAMYVVCTTGPIKKDCTVTFRVVADWADTHNASASVLMSRVRYVAPGIVDETEDNTFGEEITLSKGNWSRILTNLAPADKDGNPYYYTVEEVGGSNYNVVYTNNGIQTGTIYIKNTIPDKEDSYILPETGGSGSRMYMIGGAVLALLAAVLLYIKAAGRRYAAGCVTPSEREQFRNDCSRLWSDGSNKRGKEDKRSP